MTNKKRRNSLWSHGCKSKYGERFGWLWSHHKSHSSKEYRERESDGGRVADA